MPNADILVIGSGIAGLSFALKCASESPERKITILTKCDASESNTKYAQGGMAVVTDRSTDSYEKHIQDTLTAGGGHCDRNIVELVVTEGPKRLKEMIAWGADFDREQGRMSLGREGGHSENRIVHNRDVTGYEMEKALLARIAMMENVQLLPHRFAVDLILDENGNCFGASAIDRADNTLENYFSHTTVISSGGTGQVYRTTTNPAIATGDGVAMAIRAGAKIQDMEFIQFHPTALYQTGSEPIFLISEAVRGEGAILTNIAGDRFMKKFHPLADLAPRDIVSKAIWEELQNSGADHVLLDCSSISSEKFRIHFPTILAKCLDIGIDPAKDPIPVTPAAHYVCGGISTDNNGRTSINGLYAIGECARTGLHGANRLASNSLLEALVFSHRSAVNILAKPIETKNAVSANEIKKITKLSEEKLEILSSLKKGLQNVMSDHVGIVRSTKGLQHAKQFISRTQEILHRNFNGDYINPELLELNNLTTVAATIVNQSLERSENMGGFFNRDLGEV